MAHTGITHTPCCRSKAACTLTLRFSANRTVRQYTEQYYLPAAANYIKRAEENGSAGKRIVDKNRDLRNKWKQINFGELEIANIENGYSFHIRLWLSDINPDEILVELFAEGMNGEAAEKIKMEIESIGDSAEYKYHSQVKGMRSASDYTVRIIPAYESISVPLEDNLIRWQR